MSSSDKCLLSIIKPFTGQFENELTVEPNQIVQFIRKVDKYWFEVFFEDQIGKIPIDCCREIKKDSIDNLKINSQQNQVIFIAKHDFINNCEDGDLKFSRSDIVIGFHPINNDWWNGVRLGSVRKESNNWIVNDSDCGIFPLTFVWKLRNDLLPDYVFHSDGIVFKNMLKNIDTNKKKDDTTDNQVVEKNDHSPTNYSFYVKVIQIMEAQLSEEIDLPELNEILGVISDHDKLYYYGESISRKIKGIFPKNFVVKIDKDQIKSIETISCDNQNSDSSSISSPVPPSFSPPPLPELPEALSYKGANLFPTEGEPQAEVFQDLPPSYEAAINAQPQPVAYGYANYMFNEIEPYGRALYDFEAQDESELSLKQNEIVRLIRYYDQDWMEGEINGRVGFFPRSYITVIVDCKHSKGQVESNTQETSVQISQNQVEVMEFPPNSYAKVLYDFDGEMDQDLKIKVGDVILMLRKFTSTDWIEAQDANGNVGFVHLNLCQPFEESQSEGKIEPNLKVNDLSQNNNVAENKLYPVITDKIDQMIPANSNQLTDNKLNPKPLRRAPNAPRSNNVFPTFNQFLIQDKQEHYQFELDESQGDSSSISRNPIKSKDQQKHGQRECVITELIQTEKDYCHSLDVCHRVFQSSSYEASKVNVDVEKLIGDMQNIIKVSKNLSKLLENYAYNRAHIDQRVGICFLDLKFEINESYTQYCRNHDSVHSLLKHYEGDPISQSYIKNCLGRIQHQINCFDLSSIWIKPVQRILKYPLLLNELIKFTDEDHVDHEPLKMAFQMITDIATCINEHKRRHDLIQKYCRTKDPTLTEKLKNLNMHTVIKKSSRLRYRILSTLTFSSGTKDKDYEAALHTFQETERIIRTFKKELKEYIDSMDRLHIQLMVAADSISEYLDLKRNPRFDIETIRDKYKQMYQDYFKKFKTSVDKGVLKILDKLLEKFHGPSKLINKREDKRIDFEASLKSKNDNNIAKNTYDALNKQLIDELPVLSEMSLKILCNCIESFLVERKKLIGVVAKFQLDLYELPLVKNTPFGYYEDIEEFFRVKNNLNFEQMLREFSLLHSSSFQESASALNRLTRNRSSDTWKNSVPVIKSQSQPDNQNKFENTPVKRGQLKSDRDELISKYSEQNLYSVITNFTPSDVMEISVDAGDLVGVIKYKEPTGSQNRWYVDRGSIKGFIPRNLLTPYCKPEVSPTFQDTNRYDIVPEESQRYDIVPSIDPLEPQRCYSNIVSDSSDHSSLLSFEDVDSAKISLLEFDPLASSLPSHNDDNYYTAAYDFKATGPNQISLERGQKVLVLDKKDKSGNTDWWLVSYSNQKGYAPGNYFKN